jgi:hypothetical protein
MLKYAADVPHELSSGELQKKAILGAAHLVIGGEKEKSERKKNGDGMIVISSNTKSLTTE